MTSELEQPSHSSDKFDRLAAAGAGVMFMKPQLAFGTEAGSAVRVGLLGCGGRGTEDASNLVDAGARVVALADLFQDQLDAARTHFDQLQQAKGYAALDSSQLYCGEPNTIHAQSHVLWISGWHCWYRTAHQAYSQLGRARCLWFRESG